jgi:hypothetical protein
MHGGPHVPRDGAQARIDGWAWVGDDYEVNVVYQLVEPQIFPASAEQDLRALLAAAVDSLPGLSVTAAGDTCSGRASAPDRRAPAG